MGVVQGAKINSPRVRFPSRNNPGVAQKCDPGRAGSAVGGARLPPRPPRSSPQIPGLLLMIRLWQCLGTAEGSPVHQWALPGHRAQLPAGLIASHPVAGAELGMHRQDYGQRTQPLPEPRLCLQEASLSRGLLWAAGARSLAVAWLWCWALGPLCSVPRAAQRKPRDDPLKG